MTRKAGIQDLLTSYSSNSWSSIMTMVGVTLGGGRSNSCASAHVSLSSIASSLCMRSLLLLDPMFRDLFFSGISRGRCDDSSLGPPPSLSFKAKHHKPQIQTEQPWSISFWLCPKILIFQRLESTYGSRVVINTKRGGFFRGSAVRKGRCLTVLFVSRQIDKSYT